MNTLLMPTKSSGEFTDLRAGIFPSEDPRLTKSKSLASGRLNDATYSPSNGLTNTIAVTNVEAALSFKSAFNKQKVSKLSASYRSSLSTTCRITPHRLGSSFIDFMERFHEMD